MIRTTVELLDVVQAWFTSSWKLFSSLEGSVHGPGSVQFPSYSRTKLIQANPESVVFSKIIHFIQLDKLILGAGWSAHAYPPCLSKGPSMSTHLAIGDLTALQGTLQSRYSRTNWQPPWADGPRRFEVHHRHRLVFDSWEWSIIMIWSIMANNGLKSLIVSND